MRLGGKEAGMRGGKEAGMLEGNKAWRHGGYEA